MIDKRFPYWDVDVENGTIFNLRLKRYVGSKQKNGYWYISNSKRASLVHRLIWMVANGCDIPEGYEIHHIDGNKDNNCISNLELVTKKEHLSCIHIKEKHHWFGRQHSKYSKDKMSNSRTDKIKVCQYTLDGVLLKIWDSAMEAHRNGYQQAAIQRCCTDKQKTHNSFKWKYLDNGTQYE